MAQASAFIALATDTACPSREPAVEKEEQHIGSASLRLWGAGNRSPLGGFCWLEMVDVKG